MTATMQQPAIRPARYSGGWYQCSAVRDDGRMCGATLGFYDSDRARIVTTQGGRAVWSVPPWTRECKAGHLSRLEGPS